MEEKIKKIIKEIFNIDPSVIMPESGVQKGDIEKWDSLGQLELILKIEQELDIKFKTTEIEEMKNFSDIVSKAEEKLVK